MIGELFSDVSTWLEALSPFWTYVALFAIAYGENILPPVPGDVAVVFVGYLAGIGKVSLLVVIGLAALGGTLGFMTVYAVGRWLGRTVLESERYSWIPHAQVEKARAWLQRWGYGVVVANRFLTGARSVISLAVGMAQMDPWKTTACAALSAIVWVSLITYAGYAVGDNWEVVKDYLRTYSRVVLVLLGLVVLVQGGRLYFRYVGEEREDPQE